MARIPAKWGRPWKKTCRKLSSVWSGVNLDLGTGALVLVDLFAVRLVSWGQRLSWQLSHLICLKICLANKTWVLKKGTWSGSAMETCLLRELGQPVPRLRFSLGVNSPVSDPSSGSRFPEGDPSPKLALPAGGGSQGSPWAQLVWMILLRTKGG